MQKEQELSEILDKNAEIIDFKTRKATDTGSGFTPENWLQELEVGSIFLSRQKIKPGQQVDLVNRLMLNSYLLQDRREDGKGNSVCNLIWRLPDAKQMDIWVPTLEFSRVMELIQVLLVVEFEYKKEAEELSEPNE